MSESAKSDRELAWRIACGVAVLALTLSMMALAQANYREDDHGAGNPTLAGSAFGLADMPGRQVLVPTEPGPARGMKGFRKAVAAPGRVVDLAYAGVQRGDGDPAAGPSARRFAEAAGAVFAASREFAPGDHVLVATEEFLAARQVLAVTPVVGETACARDVREALAARAARAVVWCRVVGAVDDGGRLSLARFAPHGREELVTLAWTMPEAPTVYLDHVGTAEAGGTWRVGDGGEFAPEAYQPLFAFLGASGRELAVRWSGPEGDALDLYRQDGDSLVSSVAAVWPRPE